MDRLNTLKQNKLARVIVSIALAFIFTYHINSLNSVNSIAFVIKAVIYVAIFVFALKTDIEYDKWLVGLSVLLAVFISFGKWINTDGTLTFFKCLLSVIALVPCWYILLNKIKNTEIDFHDKGIGLFQKPKYRILFLLICWIPYFLAFYPGILHVDTALGFIEIGNGRFSFHDSWLHILPIMLIYGIFETFDPSGTSAMVVLSVSNMLLIAIILSASVSKVQKYLKSWHVTAITLFYGIMPVFGMWSVCLCKDIIYNSLLLYVLSSTYAMYKENNFDHLSNYFFILLILTFLRNNTVYVLVLWVLTLIFTKAEKKHILCLISAIALFMSIKFVLTTFTSVSTDGIRESLSVPLQQISKVYNETDYYSDEEKQYLNELNPLHGWDYYWPTIADAAKGEIRQDMIDERFVKLYLKTLKDNFGKCLDSFVLLTNQSYYPDVIINTYSNSQFEKFSDLIHGRQRAEKDYEYGDNAKNYFDTNSYAEQSTPLLPMFNRLLKKLSWESNVEYIPVLSKVFCISTYTYIFLIAFVIAINRKNISLLKAAVPGAYLWLTFLLGPCVLVRYYLFYFMAAPFALACLSKGGSE